MTAKDIFHDAVKRAMEKDGWVVTDDPLFIRSLGMEFYIDLAAERIIGLEKRGRKIAVEIKSFIAASAISEFHKTVGQFMNYRLALKNQEPDRTLYLAIPKDTRESFFRIPFVQSAIQEYEMQIIVYDPENEVILECPI